MAKAKTTTPEKKATGRPTKYSAVILKKTIEYLLSCEDEITEFWKTRGEKSDSYDRLVNVNLPTVEGLAIYLDVHRDTIHQWSQDYPIFSDTLDKLKSVQASRLMQKGLSGDYNPQMAKFLLSANHGMKERMDTTTDDKPMPQPIINVHRDNSNAENQGAQEAD